ncbi:MAG TPA: hypothetical protein ENN21_08935 [Spirochaetes bacterium]|nr:hypothetical protein [Spirochaetota bacterium]
MKKYMIVTLLPLVLTASCFSFLKPSITVREAMQKKQEIDKSDNPAFKHLVLKDLSKKRVKISGVTVKEITASGNIDYEFCVIADVPYEKGTIDCFIYSHDIKTIAKLAAGKSKIDVSGDFGRFFTLLDSSYTKIEIVGSSITILEGK